MYAIKGKNINLRTVEIEDARFILDMRMNKSKTQYLSKVENSLSKQEDWLRNYKKKEKLGQEYYFVIEGEGSESLGLLRVYDLQPESFCWGSWLIKDGAPKSTAIESALLIYEFGFGWLGYYQCHFDVRKENSRVIAFHLRFGAIITQEDLNNYFFVYRKESYLLMRKKYSRYLK